MPKFVSVYRIQTLKFDSFFFVCVCVLCVLFTSEVLTSCSLAVPNPTGTLLLLFHRGVGPLRVGSRYCFNNMYLVIFLVHIILSI